MTLPSLMNYNASSRQTTSLKKIDTIQKILASYAYEHGCLPNPSHSNQNIGISDPTLTRGIIPFSTLGLSEKQATDSFQRFYSYIVQPSLSCSRNSPPTHSLSILNFCKSPVPYASQSIKIKTHRQITLGSNFDDKDFIAYVLIFHGKSGEGSLNDSGLVQEAKHIIKKQNATSFTQFQECTLENSCDDQLFWTTRNNLVTVHFDTTCAKINDEDKARQNLQTENSSTQLSSNILEDPR